jgi:hypothetical protein
MTAHVGDIIRLYLETDWHEVIGVRLHRDTGRYELSDGRAVSDLKIEAVLQDESDVRSMADNY